MYLRPPPKNRSFLKCVETFSEISSKNLIPLFQCFFIRMGHWSVLIHKQTPFWKLTDDLLYVLSQTFQSCLNMTPQTPFHSQLTIHPRPTPLSKEQKEIQRNKDVCLFSANQLAPVFLRDCSTHECFWDWKLYPFGVDPPFIGHYKEYHLSPIPLGFRSLICI